MPKQSYSTRSTSPSVRAEMKAGKPSKQAAAVAATAAKKAKGKAVKKK
jgi:hypothetical protein